MFERQERVSEKAHNPLISRKSLVIVKLSPRYIDTPTIMYDSVVLTVATFKPVALVELHGLDDHCTLLVGDAKS